MIAKRTMTECRQCAAERAELVSSAMQALTPQELHLLLLRRANIPTCFDAHIADGLRCHRGLWEAISLHNDTSVFIGQGDESIDQRLPGVTLFIVPAYGMEQELMNLVACYVPSEVRRVSKREQAAIFETLDSRLPLLSVWWSPSEGA